MSTSKNHHAISKKDIAALKRELNTKLSALGVEGNADLSKKVKKNIDLVKFDPVNEAQQLAASVILNKAIFAVDIMLSFQTSQQVNLAQEFLHGAHFIIEDDGKLYQTLSEKKLGGKKLVKERFSSHYPTTRVDTDISFQCSPVISELLVGKATRNGKVITWFQTEGNPMTSVKGVILHTIDLVQYITTGKNVGLYGTSKFTERAGPIKLTDKNQGLDLHHGVTAETQLKRMKAIQALERKREKRIATLGSKKTRLRGEEMRTPGGRLFESQRKRNNPKPKKPKTSPESTTSAWGDITGRISGIISSFRLHLFANDASKNAPPTKKKPRSRVK